MLHPQFYLLSLILFECVLTLWAQWLDTSICKINYVSVKFIAFAIQLKPFLESFVKFEGVDQGATEAPTTNVSNQLLRLHY